MFAENVGSDLNRSNGPSEWSKNGQLLWTRKLGLSGLRSLHGIDSLMGALRWKNFQIGFEISMGCDRDLKTSNVLDQNR